MANPMSPMMRPTVRAASAPTQTPLQAIGHARHSMAYHEGYSRPVSITSHSFSCRAPPARELSAALKCRTDADQLVAAGQELTEPLALLGWKIAAAPAHVGGEGAKLGELARAVSDRRAGLGGHAAFLIAQKRELDLRDAALERVEPEVIGVRER